MENFRNEGTLVVLYGRSRAGKSTCRKHLENMHGFTSISSIQFIKDELFALGLNEEEVNGIYKKQPNPRLFDSSAGRMLSPDEYQSARVHETSIAELVIWNRKRLLEMLALGQNVVFDGPRQKELLDMAWDVSVEYRYPLLTIHLVRPELDRQVQHVFDSLADDWPFHLKLVNDKGIPHLLQSLDLAITAMELTNS